MTTRWNCSRRNLSSPSISTGCSTLFKFTTNGSQTRRWILMSPSPGRRDLWMTAMTMATIVISSIARNAVAASTKPNRNCSKRPVEKEYLTNCDISFLSLFLSCHPIWCNRFLYISSAFFPLMLTFLEMPPLSAWKRERESREQKRTRRQCISVQTI